MSDYDVRPCKAADLWFVARTMRPVDRMEVKASHGFDPLGALIHSWKASDLCCTFTHRKRPLCVFGRSPFLTNGVACVWMLGSTHLQKHGRELLKQTPLWIKRFHEGHPYLVNRVHPANHASIRWLKWSGAEFDAPRPDGFLPFIIHSNNTTGEPF